MVNREEYSVALRVRDVPYPPGLGDESREDELVSLRFREAAAPMGVALSPVPARASRLKSMALSVEARLPVLPKISTKL